MRRIFGCALFLIGLCAGCHAQVPQTAWQVNLSWTAPAACTAAAPCTYPVSRALPAAGGCPAATGTAYTLVGTSAAQATSYPDTTVAAGAQYCYVAQTSQGGAVGAPSAAVLVTVPGNPTAPAAVTATPAVGQ